MEVVQLYETTVADRQQGYTVQFLTIPLRAVAATKQDFVRNPVAFSVNLMGSFNVTLFQQVTDLSKLPFIIASMLVDGDAQEALNRFNASDFGNIPSELMTFAQHVANARLIPFEESPLGLESFGSVAATTSPLAIGAFLGFAAVGTGPLLFVAVPAGIIVCYVAQAVGMALQGLVQQFIGVPPKQVGPP
jgi:hypothetical protein